MTPTNLKRASMLLEQHEKIKNILDFMDYKGSGARVEVRVINPERHNGRAHGVVEGALQHELDWHKYQGLLKEVKKETELQLRELGVEV